MPASSEPDAMRALYDHESPAAADASTHELLARLGERASAHRFEVAPNPCVGAAVLSGGRVVAEGFHEHWGGPHAEVQAIAAADASGIQRERWDALVVTLEPCASQGKTPPCVDAIRAAGIRRVIVGEVDPDPRHRGAGIELLRAAGMEVETVPGAAPLARVSPHFLRWTHVDRVRRPRPWLIAKWAQTRTGQLVPPAEVGGGRWISGPEAQREVQVLRSRCDAILSSVRTVLADDPRLSVRLPGAGAAGPLRVIHDSALAMPPAARLLDPAAPGESAGPVWIFALAGAHGPRQRALEERGAHVEGLLPDDDGRMPLRDVLGRLWEAGARRVLLEAGPTLTRAYLDVGLVDQLRLYTGAVNGGRGASLADALATSRPLDRLDRECGPDVVLEAFVDGGG